jgi:hypothetical protein
MGRDGPRSKPAPSGTRRREGFWPLTYRQSKPIIGTEKQHAMASALHFAFACHAIPKIIAATPTTMRQVPTTKRCDISSSSPLAPATRTG